MYQWLPDNPDMGFLSGRIGRPDWNPIRMLLEYEEATQCHRLVSEHEAESMLDADVFEQTIGVKKGIREEMELLKELRRLTRTVYG